MSVATQPYVEKFDIEEMIEKERKAGFAMGPFHTNWLLERAPEKVRRNLELGRRHPNIVNTRQGFAAMDVNDGNTAAFGAVATTASETNIVGATQALINQFCAIAPNDARAGKVYEVKFGGTYGITGTPTVIWTPRWGSSTTVATNVTLNPSPTVTTVTTPPANAAVFGWLEVYIYTAPPGATAGTAWAIGEVTMQIAATSSQVALTIPIGGSASAATIDTTGQGTAGCGITMNLTWGTSSASNTFTCRGYRIRSLN